MACRWDRVKALELLERLKDRYRIEVGEFAALKIAVNGGSLFEMIIGVLLSQNTSDRNAMRAFSNLKKLLGSITPENALRAEEEVLRAAIAPAGLQAKRVEVMKKLAVIFLERGNDLATKLRELDVEEARRILMGLPGIGSKTADVILLMYFGKPTFPVDTHINRVSKRLGIVEPRARYEEIRRRFMELLGRDPVVLRDMHLLLIQHGRETCKARSPLCAGCIVSDLCCKIGLS